MMMEIMSGSSSSEREAAEYHSADFDWDELRQEIEGLPSYAYHLAPAPPHCTAASTSSSHPSAESWRRFHRRHSTARFFKERRYLLKEFPELLLQRDEPVKLLEVGCGNGSTVLPILRANESIRVYACDCSEDILHKTTANAIPHKDKDRFLPFLLDFTNNQFPPWFFCTSCQTSSTANTTTNTTSGPNTCCVGGVDFITMIFTLSAVPFSKMPSVIQKCTSVLKPGGLILFRDYGVYDMTMLRFPAEQKVGYREYMRSDGTLSYFFSLDVTRDLFSEAGLLQVELEYCCVRSINRRNGKEMRRVWVHGKFQKPLF